MSRPETWYKVDNVAKVFLATNTRRDPRVFRVSCTLSEPVDAAVLDTALTRTVRELPQFQVTMHRGLFWHYMESSTKIPHPEPENTPPCTEIYGRDLKNELLYRVSYYQNRINVEMFHALTDGNGGMLFLKVLVHNYLQQCHPAELGTVPHQQGASAADLEQDSFRKFYGERGAPAPPNKRACHLRSRRLPDNQKQFFEAHLSAQAVLEKARACGVSLTSYLAAAQMLALAQEMTAKDLRRPVAISLPVNLRNYYPSDTARNFFNSVIVAHQFTGGETLETLALEFDAKLKEVLAEDVVKARMDNFEKLEHMPAIRPVPLPIKNWVVGFFSRREAACVTATFSNMGRLTVPQAVRPFVRGFTCYCSTDGLFTTVCSYGDDLVLGTCSNYRSTNVLKNFYRALAKAGIAVTLYATEVPDL